MLVDMWSQTRPLFEGRPDSRPEIDITNLSVDDLAVCVLYLLNQSRECNAVFTLHGTRRQVWITSPIAAVRALVNGKVTGAVMLDLPALPPISMYVDGPDTVSLSYSRGDWTAMSVLALFDLLQRLITLAPTARLRLGLASYSRTERQIFETVWREYINAAVAQQ